MKKKIRMYAACFLAALASLLASCSFTASANVETSGIWVSYVVEHQSDTHIEARAYLRVGGQFGTLLTLSDGETLTCNGQVMSHGLLYYYRTFTAPAAGDAYVFVFDRGDEVLTDTVTVPSSPDTVTTVPASGYNEWDPLQVAWGNTGTDAIEVNISGTAINTYARTGLADTGSFTVNSPKGTGVTSVDNAVAGPISVSVRRCRSGSVDPAYQGGGTRAERWSTPAVVADFQPKLTLTVNVSPAYSGTVVTTGSVSGATADGLYRKYEMNESVELAALPLAGWAFQAWSGDVVGSSNPENIPTITSNMSVTATFGSP